MRKIHSELKELEWSQHLSHYKSIGIFPNAQGQVTHVRYEFSLKFKPIQALIVVLIVSKNEEDPFKIESTRVVTIFLPL